MLQLARPLEPYLIVFVASACVLIIEIVAGRILAPTIGVSLYTWTSIIGIVLAGISVGNYLGGRMADRYPSQTTLGLILLAASISSLTVLYLIGAASDASEGLPLQWRIMFLTAALFFLPSLILGMVTPVVIKLRLKDLDNAGNVVGKIYALSTVGSIFGTFITGFVLIQWIGSRETILLVALVLFVMALSLGNLWRAKAASVPLVAVFVALGSFSFSSGTLDSNCTLESNYYCIRVTDAEVEGGQFVKVLHLDNLLHSLVSLENPSLLVYSYQEIFAELATYVAQQNPSPRVLFIGGGGYTMPRHLEAIYPQSTLEVIEIDPKVTRVAFEYLGLRPDTEIVTYNEDARMAVPKLPRSQYDLVIGDVFNSDVSVPFHLTTREFNEQIRTLLKDGGIYAVNVIDKLYSGKFLNAYVNTLQVTFPYVYILKNDARWDDDLLQTYVVVASRQPLSRGALERANAETGRAETVSRFMPKDTIGSWLDSSEATLLTDNFAPVDNMLAPIYLARDSSATKNESEAKRHYNAGVELEGQGALQEALEEYTLAIELTDFAQAHNNRGAVYARIGQAERAIQDYHEAVRLEPQYALAYFNRGAAYLDLGQFQRAIDDLDEATRLDTGLAGAYASRAVAYTALGEDAQAAADIDRALELGFDAAVLMEEIDNFGNER
ncbi:MAG: fused MFS/spermidine synthase [Chloroflexi bacterium]|nr:fused MFS/spermidine synthase [Chloroflexota bacterium]